jgi:hypothetical protein
MGTYMFTFEFAGKGLRSRHNALDTLSNARPERQVKRPGFSSTVEPGHNFIPTEQAKLLFEVELERQKLASVGYR